MTISSRFAHNHCRFLIVAENGAMSLKGGRKILLIFQKLISSPMQNRPDFAKVSLGTKNEYFQWDQAEWQTFEGF